MKRHLFQAIIPLFALLLLAACDSRPEGEAMDVMTLPQFFEVAEDYVDQQVSLTGTVTHVCRHGGKRLHIVDTETNDRIRVESGENMAAFARELEGSDIVVTGYLRETRVDEAYLDEWEQEVIAEHMAEHDHGEHEHHGDCEHVDPKALETINTRREELLNSGKAYLSFWHLDCVSFRMKDGSSVPDAKQQDEHADEL